ncbi:MAG: hypothetical protein ABJC04_11180, partial [Verrucomicrobiota bacterium]
VTGNKNVIGVAPYIAGLVLLQTEPPEGINPKFFAPLLLGIDPKLENDVSVLPRSIVTGEFDLGGNSVLVGGNFAHAMELSLGDRVAIYSPSSIEKLQRSIKNPDAEKPVPQEFVVRGIFDVGYGDYNANIIAVSLENAQQLWKLKEDEAHGLQILLRDPLDAEKVREQLLEHLDQNFNVVTWQEENTQIFGALVVEKNMMFFLLFFIMIVAGFGIVNSQITFVVQKTREI